MLTIPSIDEALSFEYDLEERIVVIKRGKRIKQFHLYFRLSQNFSLLVITLHQTRSSNQRTNVTVKKAVEKMQRRL